MASAADVFAVATPSWRANGWRSANDLELEVNADVGTEPAELSVAAFVLLRTSGERMF